VFGFWWFIVPSLFTDFVAIQSMSSTQVAVLMEANENRPIAEEKRP
jgi:hypothetical protein